MKNRFAIQTLGGLYAGVDFSRPEIIAVEGHVSKAGGEPWPVKTFTSRENAEKCLSWLGPVGLNVGAQVVEVELAWRVKK